MKTVIVYDSQYGNTEQIARAMAERLGKDGRARLVAASAASERDLAGSDLLVVGGPTQIRRISSALRTFLDGLPPNAVQGVPAAAFDMRMPGPRVLTGSAATGIARRLAKKGARLMVPPESFIATGMKGPPVVGERARAGTWAATVQARARETAARPSRLRGAVVVIGPSLALVFLSAASMTAAAFGWLALSGRSKVARLLRLLSAPGVVWTVAYPLVIRPWHLHWGATAEEVRKALPGDEVVPQLGWQSTRAITIHAPARAVWRWLVQLGQGRGGFYTYDWLENLAGLDIHSAERIVPELQRLKVGDFVRSAPELAGPDFGWTVARIEPARALVLGVGRPDAGDAYSGVWTFVLDAIDDRTTRLIVRGRTANKPALVAGTLLIELQWFIMERGMLQGIKRRAERAP
jgi:flavodoxin